MVARTPEVLHCERTAGRIYNASAEQSQPKEITSKKKQKSNLPLVST
jgi:hypothetical protein